MKIKEDKKRFHKGEFSIQSIIMSVLSAVTLVTIVIMGFLLYHRFRQTMDKTVVSDTEATVESTVERINLAFLDIRHIFNAANYNVIQEFDISSQVVRREPRVCAGNRQDFHVRRRAGAAAQRCSQEGVSGGVMPSSREGGRSRFPVFLSRQD